MKKAYLIIVILLLGCGNNGHHFRYKRFRLHKPDNFYLDTYYPIVTEKKNIYISGYFAYNNHMNKKAIIKTPKKNINHIKILQGSIKGKIEFLTEHGSFLYMITKEVNYYKLFKIHKQSGATKLLLKKNISISNVTTFKFKNNSTMYIVFTSVNFDFPTEVYYTADGGETWRNWKIPLIGTRSIIKNDTLYLLSHKGTNGELYVLNYKNGNYIKIIKFNKNIFDMKLNSVSNRILLSGYKAAERGWSRFWGRKEVSVYELRDLSPVKISDFTAGEKMFPNFLYSYGNFICISYSKYEDDFFVYSFDYGKTWHKNKIQRIYDESYDFYKDKEFYGTIGPREFMAGKFYKNLD